jgi:hypothetical protein
MRRLLLLVPILLIACSDSGSTTGSDTSGSGTGSSSGVGGSSSEASSSSGLATSSTGSGTSSASSGTGGAPPVAGAPGSETVNGGDVCSSPNYKMVMTIGQPTQNQGVTTSPNYRVHGGLIGATN